MKRVRKILLTVVTVVLAACLIGLVITGWKIGWGPFTFLQFNEQQNAITEKYDSKSRQGEIIFYGASNFRLWMEMENDLSGYKVQNHGFGGSTDKDLAERADVLLYPYAPKIVFFQTGSNDYVSIEGTDEEKVAQCMAYKAQMFDTFRAQLPDAHFVVMSGLLLPGRSQYTALTQMVNDELQKYCEEHAAYMTFVDAEAMTYADCAYRTELFIEDGIHLNRDGQLEWCRDYIAPQIEKLIEELGAEELRRQETTE